MATIHSVSVVVCIVCTFFQCNNSESHAVDKSFDLRMFGHMIYQHGHLDLFGSAMDLHNLDQNQIMEACSVFEKLSGYTSLLSRYNMYTI